ncbi:MAG: hypothetical protein CMH49_09965 [Myxococcales bacterium]|nr:hypothetical protein [Myxococcales bacterium]
MFKLCDTELRSNSTTRFTPHLRQMTIMIISLVFGSCNRLDWVPIEDALPTFERQRLSISGELCTSPSEDLSFPLRVLFVVDGSESMEVTDPPDPETEESGRQRAVRETWQRLIDQSRGDAETLVGIMRFSAQAEFLTGEDIDGDGVRDSYFTRRPELLEVATEKLSVTDRTTNYLNALDTVYLALRTEALRAQGESLGRSRYVVIFLSDGLPSDGANNNSGSASSQIELKISEILKLKQLFGIGEINLHTLFLSTEEGLVLDQAAQNLLGDMAELGEGSYRSFPSGERLNFLHIELSRIKRLYSLKALVPLTSHIVQGSEQQSKSLNSEWDLSNFIDANQDGEPSCGEPMADSDMDGLADLYEIRLGTDPFNADSDGDGLRDRVEWLYRRSGLDPLDATDASCDPEMLGIMDSDGDGLNDCEEAFFGSLANRVDSDDDGIPDGVEFRFGTSPQQKEAQDDLDWDGTQNSVEVLNGFDPLCDDASIRSRVGYAREIEEIGVNEQQSCYRFSVRGLPALASRSTTMADNASSDSPQAMINENRILLYAGEGAFDEKSTASKWRVACVLAPLNPQTGLLPEIKKTSAEERAQWGKELRFELSDQDFVSLDRFESNEQCKREAVNAR